MDGLTITDSSVRINGKADNLTVNGDSVVTITGNDAYDQYQAPIIKIHLMQAHNIHPPVTVSLTTADEVIISTL